MEITRLNNLPIEVSVDFHECANYLDLSIERIPISIYLHTFDYGNSFKSIFYRLPTNLVLLMMVVNGILIYIYTHIDAQLMKKDFIFAQELNRSCP